MTTPQIIKRNGSLAAFEPQRIYDAIEAAAREVFVITPELSEQLHAVTLKVTKDIIESDAKHITIGMIQQAVEHRLLDVGLFKIAEHYIEYRLNRDIERLGYDGYYEAKLTISRLTQDGGE